MIDLLIELPPGDEYARWLNSGAGWVARIECTPEDIVVLPDGRLFKLTPPDDIVEQCLQGYYQLWRVYFQEGDEL